MARRLIFVSGKGGVGKTTIAARAALAYAHSGKRVLLVESTHFPQLPPLFGKTSPGKDHKNIFSPLAHHIDTVNLSVQGNLRDYIIMRLKREGLIEQILSSPMVASFINAVPGLAEILLLGRLYYECQKSPSPGYDVVIFDAPASGHFLQLVRTPQAVLTSGLAGPLVEDTAKIESFLQMHDQCEIWYVTLPNELVMSETLEFIPKLLDETNMNVAKVVLNRFWADNSFNAAKSQAATDYVARQTKQSVAAKTQLQTAFPTIKIETVEDEGAIAEPISAANFSEGLTSGT